MHAPDLQTLRFICSHGIPRFLPFKGLQSLWSLETNVSLQPSFLVAELLPLEKLHLNCSPEDEDPAFVDALSHLKSLKDLKMVVPTAAEESLEAFGRLTR